LITTTITTNTGGYAMTEFTPTALSQQRNKIADPLTDLLRDGARLLLAQAVEAELQAFMDQHAGRLKDGRGSVVRNGYLPGRTIQTGIGNVEVKVPKVRDRSGQGIKFNSSLLPPYLKRTRSIEELLPWLYLRGTEGTKWSTATTAK
jgi:transposase-like protein